MNKLYIILAFLLLNGAKIQAQSPTRIELEGGRYVLESVAVRMVGDSLRLEVGEVTVMDGGIPTVYRFSTPLILSVPSGTPQTRSRIEPGKYAGLVDVSVVRMEELGDELVMELEIRVRREALNRRQSLTVIPELKGPDDSSITLAGLLINGGIREKLHRRGQLYRGYKPAPDSPSMKISITHYTDTLILYNLRLPYEMWMDDASLAIHQILGSPAGKEQLFTVSDAGTVRLQPRVPYEPVPMLNRFQPEKTDKSRRMEGQAYLDFQVGRSVLLPDYRRNPEELSKIDAIIRTVLEDDDITLRGISLVGYASPEGSYESNDRLSLARAVALKNYIRDKFRIGENMFTVTNVAEDWDGLTELLEQSTMPGKERVLEIIKNVGVFEGRESRLMQLEGGRPWRSMLTELFPDLRRVEYRADFTIREYTLEEAKDIVNRKPDNLSLYELTILSNSLDKDTPQHDAVMEHIIRQYPDDPTAIINYSAHLLSKKDVNGARRLLDRVADDPRAMNNIGVLWLVSGDLDKAGEYFEMARAAGGAEALHNLEELERKQQDEELMKRYRDR